MKTYNINVDLDQAQLIALSVFIGANSAGFFTELRDKVQDILYRLRSSRQPLAYRNLGSFCRTKDFDHTAFHGYCHSYVRDVVTINGKNYYEDELALALSHIKEIK